MHQNQPVTVLCHLFQLLFYHDDRLAGPGKLLNHTEYLFRSFRIQLGGGFIQDHHLRLHYQNAGDRHPLHLSAGQFKRITVTILPDIQLLQYFLDTHLHLFPSDSQILKSVSDFTIDRISRTGKLIKRILKNQSHILAQLLHRYLFCQTSLYLHRAAIGSMVKLWHQPYDCLT